MTEIINTLNIDVVIICGGKGERLQSIVNDRPKPMAEISGRPFLDILIDYISSYGFRHFIMCIGYMGNIIKQYFNNKSHIKISFSEEKELLGTAGAIKNAEKVIKSNPFFVINGDTICRVDLIKFLEFHQNKGALASIVISKSSGKDYGRVILDYSSRVIEFNEKANSIDNFVNAGVYIFDKKILSFIPKNKKFSIEKDLLPSLVGKSFYGYITTSDFIDIGTPERYKMAKELLK